MNTREADAALRRAASLGVTALDMEHRLCAALIRYYSAGPCGNIPAEPARHAHTATSLSSKGLAIRPCPETDEP